jgi:hypothetical protein
VVLASYGSRIDWDVVDIEDLSNFDPLIEYQLTTYDFQVLI